jgi:hypothetical protein
MKISATIVFDFPDNNGIVKSEKMLAKYLTDRLTYTLEQNQFPDFEIKYFMLEEGN